MRDEAGRTHRWESVQGSRPYVCSNCAQTECIRIQVVSEREKCPGVKNASFSRYFSFVLYGRPGGEFRFGFLNVYHGPWKGTLRSAGCADGKRAVECVYSRKERYLKTGYSSHPLGMALFHAAGSPCRKRKMKKTGTGTASALRRWTMSIL